MGTDKLVREVVIGETEGAQSGVHRGCVYRTKGVSVNGETDMQRLARYVRQRRRELGITSAPRLDVLMMNEIESWYPGKAQYLETKQSEIPSSEELKALARVLQTTVTELLYVAGLLDNSDHVIPTIERRRERTGAH